MYVEPIYEEEILELVSNAWDVMGGAQKEFWEKNKIIPEMWTEEVIASDATSDVGWGEGAWSESDDLDDLDGDSSDAHERFSSDPGVDAGLEFDEQGEGDADVDALDDDQSAGFWVVAVCKNRVLWYNHKEKGFNVTAFDSYGKISVYGSKQDDLDVALQKMISLLAEVD